MTSRLPELSRVLAALDRVRGPDRQGWYTALCPFHDDQKRPNLRFTEQGFNCMACEAKGSLGNLVQRLGLADDHRENDSGLAATYDYRDEEGELLFQVVRKVPKGFLQRRPRGGGAWTWNLNGTRRVLYRLPELLAAAAAEPVFITEGEKDADRIADCGLIATTNPGGAGKWRPEYAECLRDRSVVILPDKDEAGRLHAGRVAEGLSGVAAEVRVLELPGLPDKGDVSDWVAAGGSPEALRELIGKTPPWRAPPENSRDDPAAPEQVQYKFVPATSSLFVERFVQWRAMANDAALEYAEAHGIVTLAAVAGPRLRIPIREKPRPLACNLFVVLVGPSTLARKSDVQNHTQVQLQEVVPNCLIESPGSSEGLVQDLASHETIGAVLFVDELAWWFSAVKRKTYLSEMKGYVMRAYDGSTISRRNRSRKKRTAAGEVEVVEDCDLAQEPCLSILGTSTPERLAQVSTMEDIDDGWWPRWIIVWPDGRPPMRPMGPPDHAADVLRQELSDQLKKIETRLGQGVQAILTGEGWLLANEAFRRMEQAAEKDPEFGPFISRMELRLLKVAALLALADDCDGRGNVRVEEHHVLQAEMLSERWLGYARKFTSLVGLNEFEYALNRAWLALKRGGGKAPRRDVARAAHVSARVMDDIERTLEDRGMIEVLEVHTQGRSRKEWKALE